MVKYQLIDNLIDNWLRNWFTFVMTINGLAAGYALVKNYILAKN